MTATSFAPAVQAGVVAEIWVSSVKEKLVAAVPPKVTAVTPVKSVPVMVTLVPPASGPEAGDTVLMVGASR
jgi:hypothetical protein